MFGHICEMILALGVFYSGIVSLMQYSSEYSRIKKTIRKRKESSLLFSFLKSAGITALAADSGKLVMYSTSSLCFSGLMNFRTAFVCMLGSILTSGASSFFALINERYLIYMILGLGGIMRFVYRKSKKENLKLIAMFIFSVGLLLFGITLIKDNFLFLGNNDHVKHLIITYNNPFLVILIGAVISFIMQSTAGFSFMIVGLWGSNLISYEQSILMLYGSCISSCIKCQLYALPFKGSARRLISVNANITLVSSVITVGLYFLERFTSIPLLNSLLRSIYQNVIFEVSGAMLISILFIVSLHLVFLRFLVPLYTRLYPDSSDEILAKTHYIQNIESLPKSQWPVLMSKEVDRIVANLYKLVDFESPKDLVDAKTICDCNDLIFDRIMDLHKYIYSKRNSNSLDEYLLYEKLFFLKNLNSRLVRYCEIIKKSDAMLKEVFKYAVSIHIFLLLKCLSDFICNKTDVEEICTITETLNFRARKLEIFKIIKDIKGEYETKYELASIYCDILSSLSEIINTYTIKYNSNIPAEIHE